MLINVKLSHQEAQVLINIIDVAVKAAGLEAAEAGFILAKKIKEAADEANNPQPQYKGEAMPSEGV